MVSLCAIGSDSVYTPILPPGFGKTAGREPALRPLFDAGNLR